MTDRDEIMACYLRHEKRLGAPDMVTEAMEAAADELGLPYVVVFDAIMQSALMAGNMGIG